MSAVATIVVVFLVWIILVAVGVLITLHLDNCLNRRMPIKEPVLNSYDLFTDEELEKIVATSKKIDKYVYF